MALRAGPRDVWPPGRGPAMACVRRRSALAVLGRAALLLVVGPSPGSGDGGGAAGSGAVRCGGQGGEGGRGRKKALCLPFPCKQHLCGTRMREHACVTKPITADLELVRTRGIRLFN